MTQRRFRAVAKEYSPTQSLLDLIQKDRRMAELVSALVLEGARIDAEALLSSHRLDPDSNEAKGVMGRTFFQLEPGRVEYWIAKMAEVIDAMEQESNENQNGEL